MKNELNKYTRQINNKLTPTMDWIYKDNHPVLRKKSIEVDELQAHDWEIIDQMVSYIDACFNDEFEKYNIKPGIAIAAPQMGLNKQIIYVHFKHNNESYQYLLVNPKIISYSDTKTYIDGGEGCLSVPSDIECNIERHHKIIVEAYDLLTNQQIEIVARDLLSVCLQHEIDHLNGILYPDRINKKNPLFVQKDWIKI